jgi:uroporphyrin-III C-methyltransferase/precorrin-2 dehydrogenase/sirohydrochlorin ferrochelatase
VIYRATLPGERILRAPLAELPDAVLTAGIGPPAVIIIGDVVDVIPPAHSGAAVEPGAGSARGDEAP